MEPPMYDMEDVEQALIAKHIEREASVRCIAWLDDDDERDEYYYDPERDCPRCKGAGQTALLSGIEWDYTGPDWATCPRCGGSGRW